MPREWFDSCGQQWNEFTNPSEEGRMSNVKYFNAAEWKNISAAPFMAGLVATMADLSGPVGITKQAIAVGRLVTESGAKSSSELIRGLADSFKGGARPEMPDVPKDRDMARSSLINKCGLAVAAIAAKEGGFLGFGGTQVSEKETSALSQLSAALGVRV